MRGSWGHPRAQISRRIPALRASCAAALRVTHLRFQWGPHKVSRSCSIMASSDDVYALIEAADTSAVGGAITHT